MTSTDDTPQPTEADREAAARHFQLNPAHFFEQDRLARAFARHAQQAREEGAKVADAMYSKCTRRDTHAFAYKEVAAAIRNLSLKDQADD